MPLHGPSLLAHLILDDAQDVVDRERVERRSQVRNRAGELRPSLLVRFEKKRIAGRGVPAHAGLLERSRHQSLTP